jgi:hypothetical protein
MFHQKDWEAVVQVEEYLRNRWNNEILTARPDPEKGNETFINRMIYLKGKRDALEDVWRKRQSLINQLKRKEEERND